MQGEDGLVAGDAVPDGVEGRAGSVSVQATGSSTTSPPSRWMRCSSSTSKAKPVVRVRTRRAVTAPRSKNLNPHWVSATPRTSAPDRVRKTWPPTRRPSGWECTNVERPRCGREAITAVAPPRRAAIAGGQRLQRGGQVGVEEADQRGAARRGSRGGPRRPCPAASSRWRRLDAHPAGVRAGLRARGGRGGRGAVDAAVVDHDDPARPGLSARNRDRRAEGLGQPGGLVVGGDHHVEVDRGPPGGVLTVVAGVLGQLPRRPRHGLRDRGDDRVVHDIDELRAPYGVDEDPQAGARRLPPAGPGAGRRPLPVRPSRSAPRQHRPFSPVINPFASQPFGSATGITPGRGVSTARWSRRIRPATSRRRVTGSPDVSGSRVSVAIPIGSSGGCSGGGPASRRVHLDFEPGGA